MLTSSNKHKTGVKMGWERQENKGDVGRQSIIRLCVKELNVTEVYVKELYACV